MNLLDRIEQEQKERDSRHKNIHEESLATGKLHGLLGHCEASEAIAHAAEAALSDLVARVRPLVEAAEKYQNLVDGRASILEQDQARDEMFDALATGAFTSEG